jgi:glycosyltransferase involved in cell wall biosynthesis
MRIGIDITSALTQGGGIGRYTRELIHTLVDIDQENQYQLFSAKPPKNFPVANPVPQHAHVTFCPTNIDERWLYRLWYRLRLPLPVQLLTGSLDLFHSPDFVLPPVSGGIPTIVTVHDLSFLHYPDTFPPKLVDYLQRVVPWSIGRSTHVLADSVATRDDLVNLWHVPENKISVLYCGVHEQFQPITDSEKITTVRAKYNLGESPYILSVGTVQPRKNYKMLIQAFKPVAEKMPHHLIIGGGKGWLYDGMLAEIERLGLNGRVHFIGFVDDEDLPTLYSAAALFVLPSLYEGFGIPLLEAMACGVPIISSNASSLPEVVGETAVLLSPLRPNAWTAAMLQLLNSANQRSKLVAGGFRQVQQFTWDQAARQLLNLYSALL